MKYNRILEMKSRKVRRKAFLLMAMLLCGGLASAQVLVKGNVYGGCELGQVTGDVAVTVGGGTIGDKIPLADRKVDENGQVKRIRYGNVYGGGNGYDGTDYSQSAPSIDRNLGRVQGNTSVTIKGDAVVRHAVYGGGNLGTVGVCTINDDGTTATYTIGGKTTVTIEGNALIGPTKADLTKDDEGNDLTQPVIDTAFKYLGGNEGMVFGGSRGLSGDELKELSFADTTVVIIKGNANVVGNVFGGGENGHVQKGTSVLVAENAVIGGVELHGTSTPAEYTVSGGTYDGVKLHLTAAEGELVEDDFGVGRRVFRGNVFGGGKGSDFVPWLLGQEPPVQQYSYTSGDVYGNATVQIQGGTIYNKVYGGGTMASVGTFQRTDTNNPHAITGIVQKDEKDTGHCFVTITGGQIGTNSFNNGEVYGGGRGMVGRVREEGEPLLPIHQAIDLAYVGHTHVTIDGAVIKSSVYGGSANGHVQGNTKVLIKETTPNTTYIGTAGHGAWHSNVYGGGGGTARYTMMETPSGGGTPVPVKHLSITSGRVFGDTEVEITGGKVLHNVYGGGAIASVGTYNASDLETPEYPYIGHGHAKVTITGGEIGTDGNNNGMVFGSGRGQIAGPGNFLDYVTYVAYSEVNIGTGTVNQTTGVVSGISGDAKIKGSVYGSGENGHVYLESVVNVFAGTIGCDLDEYKSYANPSSPTYDATWKTTKFPYRGNVYGAGCGTDAYESVPLYWPGTTTQAEDPDTHEPITIGRYNPLAGITQGNTKVNIYGGYISRSVYGGGAMASVGLYSQTETHTNTTNSFALSWPYKFVYSDIYDANHAAVTTGKTEVTVRGGHIGTYCDEAWDNLYALANSGDVYGGSRGMVGDRYYFVKYANVRESDVKIQYPDHTATPSAGGNFIVNSVFGGGENGHVYENTQVTIDDGLIGGSVFGGGKGKDTYWDFLKSYNTSTEEESTYLDQVHSITAGKVFGNTQVTMNNGVVQHNVFGGGEYASVGKGNYIGYGEMTGTASGPAYDLTDHAGRCVVTIKGGTIGTNGYHDQYNINNGYVYGSSKGMAYPTVDQKPGSARYDYSRDFFLGYANKTEVTIGDATVATTPSVKGSVFGGGEDGHVRWHTDVTVNKGTIGVECNVAEANSTTDEWLYRGNVYGAGRGIDKIASGLPHAGEYCSSAGSVTLNSTVIVNGGTIYRNVYGGGSMASVGPPPVANSTYNPGASLSKVEIHGGIIGTLVNENETDEYLYGGNVFGAGRGNSDIVGTDNIGRYASVKTSQAHLYTGAHIRGTLYGGGEIGQVKSDSYAYIHGGTADNSVYGAGKGVMTDEKAALVLGNSTVDMTGGHVIGSVYGGGELGNVGTYIDPANPTSSDPNLPYYTAEELLLPANAGHVLGEPKGCAENTGLASVYIKGGRVGQNGGEKMPSSNDPDDDVYGYVFAGGSGALVDTTGGLNPKANLVGIVGSTYLEIDQADDETPPPAPVITASVYGGCENGLVLGNTHVKIMAGQIGTGYRGGNNWDPAYTDAQWADAIYAVNEGTIGTSYSNPFHECDAFPYQAPYAVYDIYAGTTGYDAQGGSTQGSNGHSFFGNVFGGGSGYYPIKPGVWRRSAGRVWGDTHVEITGGHILTSVYGGNETTDVMGTCTVEMSGGTIGVPRTYDQIRSHPVTCYLFGAGMGDERVMFNTWTNVGGTVVRVTGGTIFGSVFGGGEDGHVLGDAEVNIGQASGKTTLIGTLGYSYVDGNVFGGGRGFSGEALTAGVVRGNVKLNISGGTMLGSVYGGGRLAAVGTYLVPASNTSNYGHLMTDDGTDKHGYITINITGGTIGNDKEDNVAHTKGGNVFGGCMGRIEKLDGSTVNPNWYQQAIAKHTKVNISGLSTLIKGDVYGGGELGTVAKHTETLSGNSHVVVSGGTIRRNVFGGGYGSDDLTETSGVIPAGYAGYVFGNDTVNISGGTIGRNVYGGGEMASVGTYNTSSGLTCDDGTGDTYITVSGGTIGNTTDYATYDPNNPLTQTLGGNVFGGGKGVSTGTLTNYKTYCNVNNTTITTSATSGTPTVYGSIYGGGALAHVVGTTHVNVGGGNIGTNGITSWDGNVFGGGMGVDGSSTAGRVAGNTYVTMTAGHIQGSVYGGGRLGVTGINHNGEFISASQGKATVEVKGTSSLGNATVATLLATDFSVGDIFGGGRGDVDNYQDVQAGRVTNTQVTVSGSPVIRGSVFGGGEMASVGYLNGSNEFIANTGESTVTISGGTIGSAAELTYTSSNNPGQWTMYDADGKIFHTCTGNVFGGCQGDVDFTDWNTLPNNWPSMGRSKTTTVTINGGSIMSEVYGGTEQGTMDGDTQVTINGGTIGTLVNPGVNQYYVGGVYGAGYGSDDPTEDDLEITVYGNTTTTKMVAGRVYGSTRADVLGGTINGDVYGGASFAYVGTDENATTSTTKLYIGNADQLGAANNVGTTILGSVFGANNHSGTPLGNVEVHVYHTAHTTQNEAPATPTPDPPGWTPEKLLANAATQQYALKEVFGGGNRASFIPNQAPSRTTVPRSTTVHVYACENTIRDLYGGGNAADIGSSTNNANTFVIVDGGRFKRIFGGGNGSVTPSNTNGTATTRINAGVIEEVYGGCNSDGIINNIDLEITHSNAGTCDDFIYDVFGGNNEAEIIGDIVSVINCGDGYQYEFYGGNNNATIYGNVTTNVFGGETAYLFGGSKGSSHAAHIRQFPSYQEIEDDIAAHPTDPQNRKYSATLLEYMGYDPENSSTFNTALVHTGGNVTLNLFGGIITEAAFGGSDVNGTIDGKITVNVFDAEISCPLDLKDLYGAGRNTAYEPIYDLPTGITERVSPEINVIHGTVKGNVFGGGMGATATTDASPKVNIGYYAELGDPAVSDTPMDKLYDIIHAYTDDPSTSYVWPEPAIAAYAVTVEKDVYGGGQLAAVTGNTRVNMFQGTVGTTGTSGTDGNLFGGGQGAEDSFVAGRVEGNTTVEMRNGTVKGNIYGGGRLGLTGVNASGVMQSGTDHGNTYVYIKGGTVGNSTEIELFTDFSMGNIYGGGKGYLVDKTSSLSAEVQARRSLQLGLTKNTTVEISNDLGNSTHVYGIVLGGGELASVGHYTLTPANGDITNIAVTEGKATVKVSGGTIGGDRSQMRYELAHPEDPTNWYSMYNDDLGYVYGGGEGYSDNPESYVEVQESASPLVKTRLVDLIATVQSTEVEVSGGWVKASVFGGSESGHVRGNTKVTISGGQIGAGKNGENDYDPYDNALFINPATTPVTTSNCLSGTAHWNYEAPYHPFDPAKIRNQAVYDSGTGTTYGYVPCDGRSWFGNVFGGGSGWFPYVTGTTSGEFVSHWNPLSGKVWGDTEVIIEGGHILNNVYGANEMTNVGGTATVTIKGGTVGVPRTEAQIQAQPTTSYVFGGGAGDPRSIFNDNTNVTSTEVEVQGGIIYGSVFGGAEMGHVLGNAAVTINEEEGTTVIGSTGTSGYDGHVFGGGKGDDTDYDFDPTVNLNGQVSNDASVTMSAGTVLGNVYGGGDVGAVIEDTHVTLSGGTVGTIAYSWKKYTTHTKPMDTIVHTSGGSVFGGGRGSSTDLREGWVKGNSNVNISGGHVQYSVYGGGEMASVGQHTEVIVGTDVVDFTPVENTGLATVNITGGQVGPAPIKKNIIPGDNDTIVSIGLNGLDGYVFGGGKGNGDDEISSTYPYGKYYKFANVNNTVVTVNITSTDTVKNRLWGSVFGGAEDGHVLGDARVNYVSGYMGTKGTTSYDGNIFGGGRNYAHKNYTAGRVAGNTTVEMTGGQLFGNIYGGGRLGVTGMSLIGIIPADPALGDDHYQAVQEGTNHGHTKVMVKGGTIGNNKPTGTGDLVIETFSEHSMGNVYGGGMGTMEGVNVTGHPKASSLIFGMTKNSVVEISDTLNNNTHIYGIVFGGGEIANVGKFTWGQSGTTISDVSVAEGLAKVSISGGTIGADRAKMRYEKGDAPYAMYPKYNDDLGYVYGGGEGVSDDPTNTTLYPVVNTTFGDLSLLDLMSTAYNTEVEISGGWVKASVFGGAESGHVFGNTKVTISGGQIGAGNNTVDNKDELYDEDDFVNPLTTIPITTSLYATYRWPYGETIGGNTVYNPYDPVLVMNGTNPSDGKSWFGNVFGGGSGWFPYITEPTSGNYQSNWNPISGKVWGNTEVIITGGHILNNVYGANESTDVGGKATVRMSGGTVGVPRTTADIIARPTSGFVFGGGSGDPRAIFDNITVVDSTNVRIMGGIVYGSVYGGSEDGHVLGDARVVVKDTLSVSPIIGCRGVSAVDGNVFGGGRNYFGINKKAGRVGGNTYVTITGGTTLGSVFGGGRMAQTGVQADGEYHEGDHLKGKATVNIGGTAHIGNGDTDKDYAAILYDSDESIADVYGGGKGDYRNATVVWAGRVTNSVVNITGTPRIYGSVWGGGEMAGVGYPNASNQIYANTGESRVNISGGTIGTAYEYTKDHMTHTPAPVWTSYETINGVKRLSHTCTGNVFGGSRGEARTGNTPSYPHWVSMGRSRTATVTVSGGTIMSSVYGGPEQGFITGSSQVNISGGTIGQAGLVAGDNSTYSFGSVFGGGYGADDVTPHTNDSSNVVAGDIAGRVYGNATIVMTGGQVYGNVFGGGEIASVGYYTYTGSSPITDVVWQSGGTTSVTVNGGVVGPLDGTGLNAYVFGGPKGGQNSLMRPYCNVNHTFVTVDMDVDDGTHANRIWGSLFGGGSDGHVLGNTSVTLTDGTVGTNGITGYDGNIFGAGRNYHERSLSAGRVGGNATVLMGGGTLQGSIFGGGRQGLTGVDVDGNPVDDANHGNITVTVSSGTIGTGASSISSGQVFGGGKGQANSSQEGYDHNRLGEVRSTAVTIEGDATVKGSVYGGSENGWVLQDATVNIDGGTVGSDANNLQGNVFGGGRGFDTDINPDPSYTGRYVPNAGRVKGIARANINGGTVKGNVYGGGSMGIVEGARIVNINGGTVKCNVFGGCYDVPDAAATTPIPTLYPGHGNLKTVNVRGGTIEGDVFGSSYSANEGTGAGNWSSFVNITGGTIGTDGNGNGNVFGAGYEGKVNGSVSVNIGLSAVNSTNTIIASGNTFYRDGLDNDPTPALLKIKGNVFDGSYYYGSGATAWNQYDIEGSSATYLDGTGYDTENDEARATLPYMNIEGGLYGSGTHSESGKTGRAIHVRNYGAREREGGANTAMTGATRALTTIQRGDVILLDNTNIVLSGAEDISHQYENYGERMFGLLEVDEGFYMANGSGLVLGTAGSMVLMDSIKEVRSVYLKNNTTTTSYGHPDPTDSDDWELVGIQNSNNHLYRTVTSTGVDGYLSTDDENVILFNGLSKLMVRYRYYDASHPSDRITHYGALYGFFRMRADDYSVNDLESFAYARPKITDKVNPIEGHTAPENTEDGGFLSYNNALNDFTRPQTIEALHHTYTTDGDDGGTYYNNTKQYPYSNLSKVSKMGDRLGAEDYRVWALPATLGHKWYVDGRGIGNGGWGKDATHANGWGDYPDKPKKTITGTAGICVDQELNGIGYKFNPAEDIIFVVGPIDALSEEDNLNLSMLDADQTKRYPLRLYRYPGGHPMSNGKTDAGGGTAPTDPSSWGGFGTVYPDETAGPGVNTGAMIHANKTSGDFVLNNVVVDGLYSDYDGEVGQLQIPTTYTSTERFNVTKPLVVTAPNGRITLKGSHTESAGETVTNGTILKRGYHNTDASATWYDNPDYTPAANVYHGALYVDKDATVNVEGLVTIRGNKQKNGSGTTECNVYLPTFEKYIEITDELTTATTYKTEIGVTSPIRKTNWAELSYESNTLSPVARATVAANASAAWTGCNITDDMGLFFVNKHTTAVPRTTYYNGEDAKGDATLLSLGWTWASAVRTAPDGFSRTNIDSEEDLAWLISSNHNATDLTLTADLDMNPYVWVPIGDGNEAFTGKFDGQGHTIQNLNFEYIGTGDKLYERNNYGLFGNVDGGSIDRTFVLSGTYKPYVSASISTAPKNIGGLVGYMSGTSTVSNSEAAVTINSSYFASGVTGNTVGGLVGNMVGGEIHSSMAMPDMYVGVDYQGVVGGLVGEATGGQINNSFVNAVFGNHHLVDDGFIGGLIGDNSGAAIKNCYVSWTGDNLTSNRFGSLAASNSGSIDKCFVMKDVVGYSYTISGTGTVSLCYPYTPVMGADNFGYMYSDNRIEINATTLDITLMERLNDWVDKQSGHTYARWARPGISEINGDLPVLLLSEFDGTKAHQGGFRSLSSIAGSTALQYGGPVRDTIIGLTLAQWSPQLDGALTRATASDCIFIYGDVVVAPTVKVSAAKVSLYEHASILHPGTLVTKEGGTDPYTDTYVGISFDNSKGSAQATFGMNYGLGGGSSALSRDWHMFSTPLSHAPLGFDYKNDNDAGSSHFHNPWNGGTDFSWLQSGGSDNVRYWMKGWTNSQGPKTPSTSFTQANWVDGYFPSRLADPTKFGESCVSGTDEDGRYPYGMDFYTWTEPDYHWINFKRNGPNHWHSDGQDHPHLNYTPVYGATANENEEELIVGRGYMAAIADPTFMQSHGTLNSGNQSIPVTKTDGSQVAGWNLVGNPYHGYIDFDELANANYGPSGALDMRENQQFYVVYDADGYGHNDNTEAGSAFIYYAVGGSSGGEYADQYIHPHQGFYVLAKDGGGNLNFNESMLVARENRDSHFRNDNRPAYPLVNLYLSSDNGCNDVTVIEFERPEWGGATKIRELRNGNGLFYGYHEGDRYAAMFTKEGTERVPLWFEAKEDDIFTMKWNIANGDFHSMYLIDNILGFQYDMLANDTYTFEGHKQDYHSRFYIVFDVTDVEEHDGDNTFVFHNGSEWVVNGDGDLDFIDELGHILWHGHVNGQSRVTLPKVAPSIYMFRLTNDKEVRVQKVVVKRD